MRVIIVWISCLFILTPYLLDAQLDCIAPSPASVMTTEAGNEEITVAWEAVPDALLYQVSVVDESNGNLIAVQQTTATQYTETALTPGGSYAFSVQASYCNASQAVFGAPTVLSARTSIIVVDVILQINCNGRGKTTTTTYSLGDILSFDLPAQGKGCYLLHAETTNTEPPVAFDLLLRDNGNGQLYVGNSINNPSYFQMIGAGPVFGQYQPSALPGLWQNLFMLNSGVGTQGGLTVNFFWFEDIEVTLTYCADCGSSGGNSPFIDFAANPSHQTPQRDIRIAPNPVKSLLNLNLPSAGQLSIWDAAGRLWGQHTIGPDQSTLELPVDHWPPGTYFLRWESSSGRPTIKHFIKLD